MVNERCSVKKKTIFVLFAAVYLAFGSSVLFSLTRVEISEEITKTKHLWKNGQPPLKGGVIESWARVMESWNDLYRETPEKTLLREVWNFFSRPPERPVIEKRLTPEDLGFKGFVRVKWHKTYDPIMYNRREDAPEQEEGVSRWEEDIPELDNVLVIKIHSIEILKRSFLERFQLFITSKLGLRSGVAGRFLSWMYRRKLDLLTEFFAPSVTSKVAMARDFYWKVKVSEDLIALQRRWVLRKFLEYACGRTDVDHIVIEITDEKTTDEHVKMLVKILKKAWVEFGRIVLNLKVVQLRFNGCRKLLGRFISDEDFKSLSSLKYLAFSGCDVGHSIVDPFLENPYLEMLQFDRDRSLSGDIFQRVEIDIGWQHDKYIVGDIEPEIKGEGPQELVAVGDYKLFYLYRPVVKPWQEQLWEEPLGEE